MTVEANAGLRAPRDDATLADVDAVNRRVDDLEKRFAEAFPGGDHVGHCRYHALMIEGIEWKKRLWRAVAERSVAGLAWGTMIFIGLAAWKYFLSLVGKGAG